MAGRTFRTLIVCAVPVWAIAVTHLQAFAAGYQFADSSVPAKENPFHEEGMPGLIGGTTTPAAMPPAKPVPEKGNATDILDETSGNPGGGATGPCNDGCQFCGDTFCGPPGRTWVRADYLLWWTKAARMPPLVATAPNGTAVNDLATSIDAIPYGDANFDGGGRSGARIRLGHWFDCEQTRGIEGEWYSFGSNGNAFDAVSSGDPILLRPFFDTQHRVLAVQVLAYPGVAVGDVSADYHSYFESGGLWLRKNLWCSTPCGCDEQCADTVCGQAPDGTCGETCGAACSDACCGRTWRVDMTAGYRFYRLNDDLEIRENLVSTNGTGTVPIGTMFNVTDIFRVKNDFHGAELGLVANAYRGRWSLEFGTKLAMGVNSRLVTINGATYITEPGFTTVPNQGGLLALQSNSGRYSRQQFTLIPQFNAELGYQVTCHLRAFVGYNFLYWANVSRAADQVDLAVDPRNIPPVLAGAGSRPAFPFNTTDFWAQGLNVGAELRF